jgi:hypothetical protein
MTLFYNGAFSIASKNDLDDQNLVNCHKLKKFPCLIMPMSTKCQKMRKK